MTTLWCMTYITRSLELQDCRQPKILVLCPVVAEYLGFKFRWGLQPRVYSRLLPRSHPDAVSTWQCLFFINRAHAGPTSCDLEEITLSLTGFVALSVA